MSLPIQLPYFKRFQISPLSDGLPGGTPGTVSTDPVFNNLYLSTGTNMTTGNISSISTIYSEIRNLTSDKINVNSLTLNNVGVSNKLYTYSTFSQIAIVNGDSFINGSTIVGPTGITGPNFMFTGPTGYTGPKNYNETGPTGYVGQTANRGLTGITWAGVTGPTGADGIQQAVPNDATFNSVGLGNYLRIATTNPIYSPTTITQRGSDFNYDFFISNPMAVSTLNCDLVSSVSIANNTTINGIPYTVTLPIVDGNQRIWYLQALQPITQPVNYNNTWNAPLCLPNNCVIGNPNNFQYEPTFQTMQFLAPIAGLYSFTLTTTMTSPQNAGFPPPHYLDQNGFYAFYNMFGITCATQSPPETADAQYNYTCNQANYYVFSANTFKSFPYTNTNVWIRSLTAGQRVSFLTNMVEGGWIDSNTGDTGSGGYFVSNVSLDNATLLVRLIAAF